MAKPIKETPVLNGRDASAFQQRANNVVKISATEKARMQNNYNELSKKIKF